MELLRKWNREKIMERKKGKSCRIGDENMVISRSDSHGDTISH